MRLTDRANHCGASATTCGGGQPLHPLYGPQDVDLLGRMANSLDNLASVVREICAVEVEPDGLTFQETTVKAERIKVDADYQGVRVRFVGMLGSRFLRKFEPAAKRSPRSG